MRVLVCGDRNWTDQKLMWTVLERLHAADPFEVLIEGEARGADKMAALWASNKDIQVLSFPAKWSEHGRAAGPIRNRLMLEEGGPQLVIGFHAAIQESKGTADMLRRARKAGCSVLLFPEGQELP